MKISKSKQELARIISENGGWRDGEFAAQDSNGSVTMFSNKPYRQGIMWESRNAELEGFIVKQKIVNWHQTILSRAEYFHLYPAPDADGWIEWNGGTKSPAGEGVLVDVKMRCGREHYCQLLDDECWSDAWGDENIIAYRPHKPEQSTVESRLADAVDIVKSAAPALMRDDMKFTGDEVMGERKPTIEQLTADYRNAKDYADRKQQEADDAKADVDAKLKALTAAGRAIDLYLYVTPITAKQEPELVITELRDLLVGDEVTASYRDIEHVTGMVIKIDIGDKNQPVYVSDGIKSIWATDWKFIRRP